MTEFECVVFVLALWCVIAAVPPLRALRRYWQQSESLADAQRWLYQDENDAH